MVLQSGMNPEVGGTMKVIGSKLYRSGLTPVYWERWFGVSWRGGDKIMVLVFSSRGIWIDVDEVKTIWIWKK